MHKKTIDMDDRKKRRSANPIIRWQASRIKRHMGITKEDGAHLSYQGLFLAEGEAMMDVFLYTEDRLKDCRTGYPEYVMIDASGTDVRFARIEEVMYFMDNKLEKRKTSDEKEYCL